LLQFEFGNEERPKEGKKLQKGKSDLSFSDK
jgi:hypothetical protein